MKKMMMTIIVTLTIVALGAGCSQNSKVKTIVPGDMVNNEGETKKLDVYTSFYPMYDFTIKIGGDKINVTNLVPPGTEPHDWEPATTDIVNLEKADMLVYNGVGLEHWVGQVLESLTNKNLVTVETSNGIELIEGFEHEEEEKEKEKEDEHGEEGYDPHVWISIKNAKIQMQNIKEALKNTDPGNAEYYENNYKTYAAKLDELDKNFEETMASLSNKDIVVAHNAFSYLCADYGLNQVAIEGLSPDSEPDPARMAEVINFVKNNNVKVIFFEELVSPKVAKAIASETGAKTDVLNPLEGLTKEQLSSGEDYISVMEKNLDALKGALK